MDKVELTFDSKEFTNAIRAYQVASQKTMAEILNDKGKDLCFFAAQQIPTGDPSREHPKGATIYHVLAAGGNSRKNGKSLETIFGKAVKGKGNKKLADKIYNRRRRSRGYSRAICVKMAGDLGARLTIKAGKIKHAKARRAIQSINPFVVLDVTGLEESHVENVLGPAFERGVRKTAADMNKYSQRKLRELTKKHSGKGRRR